MGQNVKEQFYAESVAGTIADGGHASGGGSGSRVGYNTSISRGNAGGFGAHGVFEAGGGNVRRCVRRVFVGGIVCGRWEWAGVDVDGVEGNSER